MTVFQYGLCRFAFWFGLVLGDRYFVGCSWAAVGCLGVCESHIVSVLCEGCWYFSVCLFFLYCQPGCVILWLGAWVLCFSRWRLFEIDAERAVVHCFQLNFLYCLMLEIIRFVSSAVVL